MRPRAKKAESTVTRARGGSNGERIVRPWSVLFALFALIAPPAAAQGGGVELAARPTSPSVFGEVGEFALLGQDGAPRGLADFAGEPWLFMSFFTRCAGPCPQMTLQMQVAQAELKGVPCALVSLSVDPGHDTPEVLSAYASDWEADTERWTFLTGEEDEVYRLMRESFSLGVERLREEDIDMGMQVTHATRLVVVDAEGRIRGYYDGESEEGRIAAVERTKSLAREAGLVSTPYPLINAVLNSIAAFLLLAGWIVIRRPGAKTEKAARDRHANLMRAAFGVSAAFLASYLYYHLVVVPELGHLGFRGTGALRSAYFAMLISHILLAVVNLPLVLRVLWLAHAERWEAHRALARITWPIWMYISVTGVLVYLLLYPLNPAIA